MNAIIAALLIGYTLLGIAFLLVIFLILWGKLMLFQQEIDELVLLMHAHRADTEQAGHTQAEELKKTNERLDEIVESVKYMVNQMLVALKPTAPSKPKAKK